MSETPTKPPRTRTGLLQVMAIVVAVFAFLYLVWPTPFIYHRHQGEIYRVNRFSGAKDRATGDGWERVMEPKLTPEQEEAVHRLFGG